MGDKRAGGRFACYGSWMRFACSVLLVGLWVLSGCVKSVFEPYSARQPTYSRAVEHAQQVYDGDVQGLVDAGAVRIGYLRLRGTGRMDTDDIDERAAEDAAKLGGTHYWRVNTGAEQSVFVSNGQVFNVEKPTGQYLIFRLIH